MAPHTPEGPEPPLLAGRSTTLVELDRWRRRMVGAGGRRRLARWVDAEPALLGWSVDDLASPVGSARTDAMQAALVQLAQRGDGEAAVTLLVQLRPGLVRLVRWSTAVGLWSQAEADDEVRAAFFETLYRHRLDRRPRKIAANLLLDTRQRLHRARHDRLPIEAAGSVEDRAPAADTGTVLFAVDTLRSAVARLPGSHPSRRLTAELAYRAWVLDQSPAAIAAELGLGRAAVSTRLHRLRSIARDLAA